METVDLLGRESQALALERAVGSAAAVLLHGSPGLGVTALLASAAARAERDGAQVVRGRAARPHRDVPYGALAPWLTATPGSVTGPTLAAVADTLLTRWSAADVVAIDDLHQADDASLLALREVARTASGAEFALLLGAHTRPGQATYDVFADVAEPVPLTALDARASVALAARLSRRRWGCDPSPALVVAARGAGGNPWLLRRLVEHVPPGVAEVPDAVAHEFLAALDPDQALVVATVASLDGLATEARLARALGRPVGDVVTELVALGFVRRDAGCLSLTASALVPALAAGADAEALLDLLRRTGLEGRRLAAASPPTASRLARDPVTLGHALLWSGRAHEVRRLVGPVTPAIAGVVAQADLALGRTAQAVACLDAALPSAPHLAGLAALARVLDGDPAGAYRALESAVTMPVAGEGLAAAWQARALLGYLERDSARALADLDTAIGAGAYDDPGACVVDALLRVALLPPGDPECLRLLELARPQAHRLGHGWLAWWHLAAALAHLNAGDVPGVERIVDEGLGSADPQGMQGALRGIAALVASRRGEVDRARRLLDHPVAEATGVALFYANIRVHAEAEVASAEGRAEVALGLVRTLIAAGAVLGTGEALVRIALRHDDRAMAESVVSALEAAGPDTARSARLGRARLAGDVDALLDLAGELAADGDELEAAWAGADAALLLAAAGETVRARAVLTEASARFQALGAQGERDRAAARLRQYGVRLGVRGPRKRPPTGWAGLTETELRVARLVADGCTNPEIAAILVVSPRTVQTHVSRILAKLGVGSRVEIAAQVLAHA